jgi:hypothetical protein
VAFNLSASLKSNLTSAVNTVTTTVNTVGQNISVATGVSTAKINSALLGSAAGGILNGGKGAALGALAGGILGGGGAADLLGQVQNKLNGLISSAEELTSLISNPLKIIERGAADLMGVTGEEYALTLSQYRELSERSAYTNFIDNGYMSPYAGDDSSASRVPNPLRNHNGYNYVISLGVLSAAEYNNPESYRSAGGLKNYVIQSSSGNLDKRYQVFDERPGDHAEYFIDDIEMDGVISPNPNTRLTIGTALSFTVTEPYSMGNFIQAIIGAAADAGYDSYTQAPFCLKIDFAGWNLDGTTDANFLVRPIFLPIQLINMDFNVSGTGSKYQVKAVPMSESGLTDNVNKIKTSIKASGLLCHQILETNDTSITGVINRQIQDLEEIGALAPYDRYIIAFPKTRTALVDALKVGTIVETAFTTTPEEREEQRRAAGIQNPQLRASFSPTVITIPQINQTYSVLKSFAENTNLMNEIGLSTLNEDTNAPGNTSEADASAVTNPETGLTDTTTTAAQPADKARDFQFSQNEQVTAIIEKIVLQTTYAAERATAESKNGLNKWFKIDTQVFIDDSPATEAQMGRKPKVYVYSVVPYEVDEAATMGSSDRAKNTKGLRKSAVKEYNYIYTGKNEDIISFDVNFNNAFMMTATANMAMNKGAAGDPNAGATATQQTSSSKGASTSKSSDAKSKDDQTGGIEFVTEASIASGYQGGDIRRQIAENFNDRITNMIVDMVTAEMEILGDPFFISQETGNYVAPLGDKPNITADGTMTYQQGPVICIVNFRTPFDYQIKGATMELPQIVPGFSGLFQVWAVTNRFSGGKFTQTLKMIRRKGQDDSATTGNSGVLQVDNKVAISKETTQSDGTVGQSGMPSTDCMPAPSADDIRKLMPAVADDVASALTAKLKAVEATLKTGFDGIAEAAATLGTVPDLTKVIPRIASAAAGGLIGNALGGKLGAITGVALGAQLGSLTNGLGGLEGGLNSAFNSLGDPNAPPYTGDDPIIRARLGLPAVNTASTQIAAESNLAASKARNLLG